MNKNEFTGSIIGDPSDKSLPVTIKTQKVICPNDKYWFELMDAELSTYTDIGAMVSPEYKVDVNSIDNVALPGSIGKIRFKRKSFSTGIIAHEAVHCATSYMRIVQQQKTIILNDEIDKKEEDFAWLVGWFAKEITNGLYAIYSPSFMLYDYDDNNHKGYVNSTQLQDE